MAFTSRPQRQVSKRARAKRPRRKHSPKPPLAQKFERLLELEVLGEHPGLVEAELRLVLKTPGQLGGRPVPRWRVQMLLPTLEDLWDAEHVAEAVMMEWCEGKVVKTPRGIYRACPACGKKARVGPAKKKKEAASE